MKCTSCKKSKAKLAKFEGKLMCAECLDTRKQDNCVEQIKIKEEITDEEIPPGTTASEQHDSSITSVWIKSEKDDEPDQLPQPPMVDVCDRNFIQKIKEEIDDSVEERNCSNTEEGKTASNASLVSPPEYIQVKEEFKTEEVKAEVDCEYGGPNVAGSNRLVTDEDGDGSDEDPFGGNNPDKNNDPSVKEEYLIEELSNDGENTNSKQKKQQWNCKLCDFKGASKYAYVNHLQKQHPEERVVGCSICYLTFKGETLHREHLKAKHEGFENICKICMELYSGGALEIKNHKSKCLGRLLFNCKLCTIRYGKKENLWKHLDESHAIADGEKESSYTESRIKERFFNCDICQDGKVYDKTSFKKHVKDAHNGRHFGCTYCSKAFSSKSLLFNHKKDECTVGPSIERFAKQEVQCPQCQKTFGSQYRLDSHIKTIHRQKPKTCEICQAEFKTGALYRYHKTTSHSEPKYHCSYCPKKFYFAADHQTHLSAHQNTRNILCEFCGLTFNNIPNYFGHCLAHHRSAANGSEEEDQKPSKRGKKRVEVVLQAQVFFCEECNMSFTTSAALKAHLTLSVIHMEVECKICYQVFENAKKYDEHVESKSCPATFDN